MEAIVNNLIKAIGWSILHSLWQGAIIYALLFVAFMVWTKMSARLKHNLAFGSLFLIFASFCFTFFSIFELPSVAVNIKDISLNAAAIQDLTSLNGTFNLKTETYFPFVVAVYAVGIIFQVVILLSGYAKLKKLKQANTLLVPEAWQTVFQLTVDQLKLNKTVQFFLSSKVNVPLVVGYFKPVVLFPIALATQLDLKQVEAILIHELSHIRRNDYLINLVKTCIETLLFFNPFVWLTTKFIHIEREHACDDLVVNFTGTPLTYAHALLKLELLKDKQTPALTLAATGKNQHLYQRIKRITDMKTNYINAKQQIFILTMAIATVASLAWMSPTKKAATKSKKTPSLTLISTPATEIKDLNHHLIAKSDTDTTKKRKKQFQMIIKGDDGKQIVYNSYDEVPDSLKKKFKAIEDKFSSPEWKEKMAKIQLNAEEIEKKYNSPEWKEKMAKIEKNAEEIEKKYNSPEWKEKMAKIQLNADELEKKFNSPEWKDKMAKVQFNSEELEKKFNSPEWKDKMAKIEFNSKELEKKFNSPEWKDKMAKIEFNSKELEKKFNSPEWKDKMAKIEFNSKELEKKFDSPEWKKKIEDLKKLQESPEYKELRKKYESDLEELKKAKGIKDDKAFFLFDGSSLDKMYLPLKGDLYSVFAATLPLTFKSSEFKFEGSNYQFDNVDLKLKTIQSLLEKSPSKTLKLKNMEIKLKPIEN